MLLLGVGNPLRGDDGVGPEVASRVARLGIPGLEVVTETEPLALIEHLQRSPAPGTVVVVDATAPGAEPGRVRVHHVHEAGAGSLARPGSPFGSHGLGVGHAVELARSLGLVPARLTLVGVEAASAGLGEGLSAPVLERIDEAVRAVVAAVTDAPASSSAGELS